MAIGPRELNLKLFGEEEAMVNALERRIDEYLKKSWEGGTCSVSCTLYREGVRSIAIQNEIKKRFLAAGWRDVTFHSDQRDGEWVELHE